ncbi:MAG: hypothetical protein WBX21_13965 [Aestuariivirga sp.]
MPSKEWVRDVARVFTANRPLHAAWVQAASMNYSIAGIPTGAEVEIQVFLVSRLDSDAVHLAQCFEESRYHINVRWISAKRSAWRDLCVLLECQTPVLPSIIVLSFADLGQSLWDILFRVQSGMKGRYLEYIITGVPPREQDRPERKHMNVTFLPALDSLSSLVQ